MEKDCSTCDYCEYSLLHNEYVCENEDSLYYGVDIDDWLDGGCDRWVAKSEE